MAELADEVWIAREDNSLVAEVLDRSCRAAGFVPKLAVRAHDYQEVQALVSVGLGIAILPLTAIANRRPDIRAISLGDSAPTRRILLGERRVRVRPPAEGAMAAVMRDAAEDYLAAVASDAGIR
jgi:DNA-binding transcriptional LysR family regulator